MQTDRTTSNNKPDMICNHEGTCLLIDTATLEDRNVIKKEGKTLPYTSNTANVTHKNKSDTNNNKGNWNHLKIIQKIPEQNTGKA